MRETSHEAALSLILREYCYKLRPLERSRQLVADTQTHSSTTRKIEKSMEFTKEKARHLTYLAKIRPRPSEVQNVLTFTMEQFANDETTRLEYMKFIEEHKLQHSWAALLGWWRYRKHSDDKTAVQSLKRTMEIKKKEEYTLYHNNNRHHYKQRRSPLTAAAASPVAASPDDETTPPPPPSPPKKKKTQ